MPRNISVPKLLAAYAVVALSVPLAILLGVASPDAVEVFRTGICPDWHVLAGTECSVGQVFTGALVGPERFGITVAMTASWSLAIAMALMIYFGMRAVIRPTAEESD